MSVAIYTRRHVPRNGGGSSGTSRVPGMKGVYHYHGMGPNFAQVERVADSELVYVVKEGEEDDCGPRKESQMTPEERFERIENNLAAVAIDLATVSAELAQIAANGRKTDARLDRAIRLGIQEVR